MDFKRADNVIAKLKYKDLVSYNENYRRAVEILVFFIDSYCQRYNQEIKNYIIYGFKSDNNSNSRFKQPIHKLSQIFYCDNTGYKFQNYVVSFDSTKREIIIDAYNDSNNSSICYKIALVSKKKVFNLQNLLVHKLPTLKACKITDAQLTILKEKIKEHVI